MESNDSYPVFHTRLARTERRRLERPDGSSAGWLIATGDSFTEVSGLGLREAQLSARTNASDDRDSDDPPQLAIPHPR